ncbi:5'-3' exonuclease H3TH domain-containing protein [Spongiactinospora sp. TRM90649]|uniref:5'-3' exonuclease n=1 Tax=Spongiactinospora sp. TRM90649 TaxID=3031114 RepID=UPI0023F6F523|nr:5'-3' exonuclease H3TH domain-containing protein [Spongiactinospora sp. TRM90649]MDF5759039.1 5'-3' exonuclease H3TH domain-containing protein [Spongiactinospora sp. TRM90649]
MEVPLLLVDGHNLLFRATFGFPAPIHSRDKTRDLTGVFGFFALLRVAIRDELPDPPEVIVVFDGEHGSAARREADATYKANRVADETTLKPILALPDVKRGLDAYGIPWMEIDDCEADDTIATLTHLTPGRERLIMSGDRDFYQLLTDDVQVLNTAMHPGKRHIGPAQVIERYGVTPGQWPCFRALCGDPSDNIPGVQGIGQVTAARLLSDGLTLEDLPRSGRLTGAKGQRILHTFDQVLAWRELIRTRTDVAVPYRPSGGAAPALPTPAEILDKLGLW